MTDDRAVSTVQTVLAETRWLAVPCPTEYLPALARDVLYALEKAGFAVVGPLPEPFDVTTATEDEHGWRTWSTEYGQVQVSDSGCVAIDRIYRFSDLPEEPGYLRGAAAAFLSAAVAAESVSVVATPQKHP